MRDYEATLSPISTTSPADAERFAAWAWAQKQQTVFDADVINYPRACIAKVAKADETVALVPVHPVLMIESFCREPGLSPSQRFLTLHSLDAMLTQVMHDTGMAESFFVTSDSHFADVAEQHGWIKYLHDTEKQTWLMKKKFEGSYATDN